jgi:photosystem II cytochrome c550
MKKSPWLVSAPFFFALQMFAGGAIGMELSEENRTVLLNNGGETTVITLTQVSRGKRLFNDKCSGCHVGGVTKTDPNVTLSADSLERATPPRNTLDGLVDYMKNPTTYDGSDEISELHPSTKSADVFTEMRGLTDEDLKAIAGHILIQPKINPYWSKR